MIKIGIEDLKVLCIIGVLPKERKQEQEIALDIEIELNRPPSIDRIDNTIDYRFLAALCRKMAAKDFFLLESLAQEIVHTLLQRENIARVRVVARKKSIPKAAYAYVVFEQSEVS